MTTETMLTVYCATRKRHRLATVVLEDGVVYIEAPRSGRSRRHGAKGAARRRPYDEGTGARYGCACGSTFLRDRELRRAVKDGHTEMVVLTV